MTPRAEMTRTGMTLTEVIIASALAGIVVLGIARMDAARVGMEEDLRRQTGILTPEHGRIALATIHLAKHLERADRLDLDTGTGRYKLRIPRMTTASCTDGSIEPSCFDDAANYLWEQYVYTGSQLDFYSPADGCLAANRAQLVGGELTNFALTFADQAPMPPGGEPGFVGPAGSDNNLVNFALTWADSTGSSRSFAGNIAVRGAPYTDYDRGLQAPGVDVSPPPPSVAPCP